MLSPPTVAVSAANHTSMLGLGIHIVWDEFGVLMGLGIQFGMDLGVLKPLED